MRPAILMLAMIPAAAHAQGPSDYAYGLAIETPPAVAFARMAIPSSVYEGVTHPDLADMRIFNADGEVVPFAFVPRKAESAPSAQQALRTFPLYVSRERGDVEGLALSVVRNAGGSTTINVASADAEQSQDRVLGGYVLDTSEHDDPVVALTFAMPAASAATTMRMRIDASDDLVTWRTLRADATLVLLDYAGQRLVRNRVELPPAKAKYLRLSWRTGQPVIDFEGVTGEFGNRVVEPEREWRTVAGSPVAGREGEYEYDIGGAFPVDRIALELAAANSIVPATVHARSTAKSPWQVVGTTVFYRTSHGGVDSTSPPFAVDGRSRRYWMLRIDPRSGIGGPPAPALRVGWATQELVFAPRGRAPFTLAFGKYEATPGALPIDTLVPDYASRHALPPGVALARTAARVDLGGVARLQKPPDVKRWALWGALLLGALVLGWMAWRLSRDIAKGEGAPGGDTQDDKRE
jgi:hypothetical protein